MFFFMSLLAVVWSIFLILRINNRSEYVGVDSILYSVLTFAFFGAIVFRIVVSSIESIRARGKKDKRGLSLAAIAYSIMAVTILTFNIILPFIFGNYDLIWMGVIGFFIFNILIFINIVKNEYFDLKENFLHIVSYAFVVIFVVALYLLALGVVYRFVFRVENPSLELYTVNAILVIILILMLPLINEMNFFLRRFMYVDTYDIDGLVAKMNREVLGARDIERTLEVVSSLIINELNVTGAYFVIMRSPEEISLVSGKTKRGLNHDEILIVNKSIAMGAGRVLGKDVVMVDELPANLRAARILRERRFAALAKMFVIENNGRKLAGFLLVGEKHRHRKFDPRSKKALAIITGLTAIAITNIEYYSRLKIRDTQQPLPQGRPNNSKKTK